MTICKRLSLFLWDLSSSSLTCRSLVSSHVNLSNWDCASASAAFSKYSANKFSLPFCIIFLRASFFFCSLFIIWPYLFLKLPILSSIQSFLPCYCLRKWLPVTSRAYFAKRSTTRATRDSNILTTFMMFFVFSLKISLILSLLFRSSKTRVACEHSFYRISEQISTFLRAQFWFSVQSAHLLTTVVTVSITI